MVPAQLDVYKHKNTIWLAVFLLFFYVTELNYSHPRTVEEKMHHFMTCYKMCAFHCKLCRKKKQHKSAGRNQTSRTDLLSPCHFTKESQGLPQLSTAKGCSIVTDQTHTWHSYHLISAQRLLPLSCALLGDLHITSLHTLTQTETCTNTHAHKRLDSQKKKKRAHPVFLWLVKPLSDRDVTLLHADKPVGLKWGERARMLNF